MNGHDVPHFRCQPDRLSANGVADVVKVAESQMPSLVVASQCIGLPSEVWMWRQIVRFRRLAPRVLTWHYTNRETFPLEGIRVHELPFAFDPKGRWSRRIRNLRGLIGGNVYARRGAAFRALRSYFRKETPSLLLCHFGYVALTLLDVAEEFGVPLVAHFHGRDVASMLRFRAYRRSLTGNLHRFAEIVVVGSHQKQWMLEQGCRPERVHVIPCGVPTAQFVYGTRAPSETVRFLAVGRLAEMKGPEYTLKAFALTRRRVPQSSLTMVGDGPMRAGLERTAIELGVADSVRFTGSVSPEEVCRELTACDVFLQHSVVVPGTGDCEGFGVAVAEAASMGLPVVSTLCPGIVDQVRDGITGFLVPQRDAEAMATRMIQLAQDPGLRASMGTAGRQRAVSCFDVEKQVRELEDVLLRASEKARV